jgi:hypothetical protein
VAIGVLQVDLVEQLAFGVRDVVTPDAVAGVDLRRQDRQELVEQLPLHHPDGRVLFPLVPEDVRNEVLFEFAPAETAFPGLVVDPLFFDAVLLDGRPYLTEVVLSSILNKKLIYFVTDALATIS